jgi:hypothetical protein
MLKAAIEKILGLAPPTQLEYDGRNYVNEALHAIKPPVQSDLKIATLTGIADYFRQNPDNIALDKAVVHISSHKQVEVVSSIEGPWIQRHSYLTATIEHKSFRYGQFLPLDEFMIAVQTYFVQDDITAQLLKMIGNITDASSANLTDDGVSQQVQIKAGARIENALLPNPIILAPYRTFTQVEQPQAAFVLRVNKSAGEKGTTAALFEADGGNWQNTAIFNIKDWMEKELPEGTTILQ